MNNSLAILSEIEIMLREKHVSFEGLTHLKWIRERTDGKRFSMSGFTHKRLWNYLFRESVLQSCAYIEI